MFTFKHGFLHEYPLREFLKPVESQIKDGRSFLHALGESVLQPLKGVMAAPSLTGTQDAILWGLAAFGGCLACALGVQDGNVAAGEALTQPPIGSR